MTDPFATALGALLKAPGSVAAVYMPAGGGAPLPIRTIRHQPSELVHTPVGSMISDGNSFVIARSAVAKPAVGDMLQVAGETLTILSGPMLDAEGLSWLVEAA